MIRNASEKDFEILVELHKDFAAHLRSLDSKRYRLPEEEEPMFRTRLNDIMGDSCSRALVYECKQDIAGYALGRVTEFPSLIRSDFCGDIEEVFVREQYRQRGIASYLVKEMIKFFKEQKAGAVELYVDPRNAVALNSWARLGFREVQKVLSIDLEV
jgi:ribosomal protein S18 acetylase RimI-like enzyme